MLMDYLADLRGGGVAELDSLVMFCGKVILHTTPTTEEFAIVIATPDESPFVSFSIPPVDDKAEVEQILDAIAAEWTMIPKPDQEAIRAVHWPVIEPIVKAVLPKFMH